ncbi:MAG TPA: CPBP family intramembrane glutamic endopeptidase [Clostridia bacterium]|nr:CPBP family intramembrane glutamic endopeptidase [Clostridia bacterium]
MTMGSGNRDIVPALFRVTAIFIVDFLINIVWSVVTVIVFGTIFYYSRGTMPDGSEMLDRMVRSPQYLFIISGYNIFIVLLTFLFWKYIDKRDTSIIGLRWRRNSLKLFGLGLLGGTIEIAMIMLLSIFMGTLWFQSTGYGIFSGAEIQMSLLYGILAFLLVGFGEEALFRGYIQKRLMLAIGNKRALLISSLIFMAAHILTYGKLLDFIDVALGGVILGYLYILTDSLYLPAAYHFIYDLIQVNIVRLQDYEHFKGAVLFIFNNSGDVVISGINYGNVIEVSFVIIELVVLLLLYSFRDRIRSLNSQYQS